MKISPTYSIWLSIALAVLAVLAGAGAEFTDLGLDPVQVKAILAANTLLLALGNAVNAVLAAIPSGSTPQDLAKFPLGPKP